MMANENWKNPKKHVHRCVFFKLTDGQKYTSQNLFAGGSNILRLILMGKYFDNPEVLRVG